MKYRLVIILLMFMFVGSAGNAQTFRDSNNMQTLAKWSLMAQSVMPIICVLARSTMMEPSGITTIVELALSRRMGQSETTIMYDLVQLVLMVLYVTTTICVLGLSGSDGTVRNNNNLRIGTASGIDTRYAAVLFFFNLL